MAKSNRNPNPKPRHDSPPPYSQSEDIGTMSRENSEHLPTGQIHPRMEMVPTQAPDLETGAVARAYEVDKYPLVPKGSH